MNKLFFILLIFVCSWSKALPQEPPDGAALQFSKVVYKQTPTGYNWAQARCDVATLQKGIPNNGYIEVDFMEVIQENLDNQKIDTVAREDYNTEGKTLTTSEGGLFLRNPWFIPGDKPRLLSNAIESGGKLVIKVGEQSDLISHIWTECTKIDANTRLKVRIRFRITGEIGFQFGLDYSPTSNCGQNNHIEAFYSPWYFDTKGQFITETFPDYNKLEKFGREHYGVYSNGTFFVSKPLVDYIQGNSVKLVTLENNWQLETMNLIDNKYQCNINKKLQGEIRYCFQIDGLERKYIPHAVDSALVYWKEDAKTNGKDGYDFVTEAISPSSIENQQSPEDLQLILGPDNNYLYIKSRWPIKRLFVTDMAGRKSYDYLENVPEKIIVAGLNTGTYIVNIETTHGNFAKKFIK